MHSKPFGRNSNAQLAPAAAGRERESGTVMGSMEQLHAPEVLGETVDASGREQGTVTKDQVVAAIRDFFTSELFIDLPNTQVHLIEGGFLDSMDLVRLLGSVHRRFGVSVQLVDLELADLGSVEHLADAVVRHS